MARKRLDAGYQETVEKEPRIENGVLRLPSRPDGVLINKEVRDNSVRSQDIAPAYSLNRIDSYGYSPHIQAEEPTPHNFYIGDSYDDFNGANYML